MPLIHGGESQATLAARLSSRRLGNFALVSLVAGVILEIAALSFLAFLWGGIGSSPDGENATQLWRTITLRGWTTQAVTVSTVLLRSTLAAQATICTGLVAALLLEDERGVPFQDLAAFSILRAVNGGPWDVSGRLLSRSYRQAVLSRPAILVAVLALTTPVLQFSSTILISDFREVAVLGDREEQNVPVMNLDSLLLFAATVADQPPATFPVFAEQSARDRLVGKTNVTDTGLLKRAFLPFPESKRRNLRHYDGAAVVIESRVSCVAPSLIATNITAAVSYETGIYGNVSWTAVSDVPGLGCGSQATCSMPLRCNSSVPTNRKWRAVAYSSTTICSIYDDSQNNYYGSQFAGRNNLFFVIRRDNLTTDASTPSSWTTFADPSRIPAPGLSTYAGQQPLPPLLINAALCSSMMRMSLEIVKIRGNFDAVEPSMGYDTQISYDTQTPRWKTLPIISMVGTEKTAPPNGTRQVLSLVESRPATDNEELAMLYNSRPGYGMNAGPGVSRRGDGLPSIFWPLNSIVDRVIASFSGDVSSTYPAPKPHPDNFTVVLGQPTEDMMAPVKRRTVAHPYYTALADRIMADSGNPAFLLQSLMTWIAQEVYYSGLPVFDFGNSSVLVYSRKANIPRVWYGFATVTTLYFISIVSVTSIAVMFLRGTRHSYYGNAWHVVAQMVSASTLPILDKARDVTDGDIGKLPIAIDAALFSWGVSGEPEADQPTMRRRRQHGPDREPGRPKGSRRRWLSFLGHLEN